MDWWINNLTSWLPMSPLEMVATVFGLWSVWAYVKESVWSWPTGLLNVLLYIVLFWNFGLYAETSLQVVFVVLQVYGWWQWVRGGEQHTGVVITNTATRLWAVLAVLAVLGTVVLEQILARWTDSAVPWWDAVPTALSLIAQWMISKKKLENWLVWIAVDLISIPLFAYKGLYLTAGLYVVFLVLCIIGYRAWRTLLRSSAAA